jgi:hypothetical protein
MGSIKFDVMVYLEHECLDYLNSLIAENNVIIADKQAKRQAHKTYLNDNTWIENRIKFLKHIVWELDRIYFDSTIPKHIKPCLSEYGTFCNRKFMWIDIDKSKYTTKQLAQIILCEFLNAHQAYYVPGFDKIGKSNAEINQGNSVMYMHLIGMVKENIWPERNIITTSLNNITIPYLRKHPEIEVISFPPNGPAAKYLMDELCVKNNSKLGKIVKIEETAGVKAFKVSANGLQIDASNPMHEEHREYTAYYAKHDGTFERVRSNSRPVMEHLDAVDIINQLARAGNGGW